LDIEKFEITGLATPPRNGRLCSVSGSLRIDVNLLVKQ